MYSTVNLDVWAEILKCLRVCPLEMTGCCSSRGTLLSVALTCSDLLDPALSELWRCLATLEHVVRIYDRVSTPGSASPAFKYEADGGYWTFDIASEHTNALALRLRSYLHRVRYLYFDGFPKSREYTLWPILLALSGSSYLCPNLQGLSLHLMGIPSTTMCYISPLISPSIIDIELIGGDKAEAEKSLIILLNIIRGHDVNMLRRVSFDGRVSSRVLKLITQFHSLQTLKLTSPFETADILNSVERLQHLTQLTQVNLNMRTMSRDSARTVFRLLGKLETLSKLSLYVPSEDAYRWASSGIIFYHVLNLCLGFRSGGMDLLSQIPSQFPVLQSLFVFGAGTIRADLPLKSQASDLPRPNGCSMKQLVLGGPEFSPGDFPKLFAIWPLLEELQIHARRSFETDPEFILTQASKLGTRLRCIFLPFLDVSPLSRTPTTSLPLSNSPLQELFCLQKSLPQSFEEKQKIVVNLLALFPRLVRINWFDPEDCLQSILDTCQGRLLSPPGGDDRLSLC